MDKHNKTDTVREEELTFYYNRDDRLKRAPENVQKFYNGTAAKPPKGLFKALIHTSHGKFMLAAVGISLAVVFIVLLFGERSNAKSAGGIDFELSAFSFEDSVYVSIKAAENKTDEALPVNADIRFSALSEEGQVLSVKENSVIYEGKEVFYRTIFTDYDILYIQVEISVRGEALILRTRVEQK